MRRTLRPLGLAALLLAAGPALADPELTDKDKLTKILQEVTDVKKELTELRTTTALQAQNTTRDVRELQRRMEELERSFERLAATRTRVAASFTPSDPGGVAGTATVRMQNRFDVPATIYVNGQPHTVPPYDTRRTTVPSGTFTYEVQAEGYGVIRPAVTRSVNPNDTYSIFINPPAAPQLLLIP
jgi:hypothetical protein